MLQGKKAYICSTLSAPDPEGVQHNMESGKILSHADEKAVSLPYICFTRSSTTYVG